MTQSSSPVPPPPLDAAQLIARQLDLSIVCRSRVVVIGLGGVGLVLARSLTTFLAAMSRAGGQSSSVNLMLCDGDAFEEGNSYRMDVPELGNKAEVLGRDLLHRTESSRLHVRWTDQFVTTDNVAEIIVEGDCVMLACDNHATRNLVGRHCAQMLRDVVLISGGNDGVEQGLRGTYGNVQVHVRRAGRNVTAPLEQFHPEIARPQDQPPSELSCLELAAAGVPQIPFVNLTVASTMCNALLRLLMVDSPQPMYDEVAFDILEAVSTPHWLTNPSPR